MHSSGPCTVEAGSGWRSHPFRQSMPGFSISEVGTRLPGCLAKVPRAVYHPHIVVRLPLLQWIVEKALPGWESGGKK